MKNNTMEKLDRLNVVWVLENLSVGNLVRGMAYVLRLAKPVKECVVSAADKIQAAVKEEATEQKPKEPEMKSNTAVSETPK